MDVESKYAVEVLEILADRNARLLELALTLGRKSEVVQAFCRSEWRKHQTGTVLARYVDAKLCNSMAATWCLRIYCDEVRWLIESCVVVNDEQGKETIKEFPNRGAQTLEDFSEQLLEAVSQLVGSVDVLDSLV